MGFLLFLCKSATIYQYTADGLGIGSVSPGAGLGGISSWLDNQASVAVNRDPRDGMLDIFTEDNYGLHIGWYRVDDRKAETLTVSLTPSATPPVPMPVTPTPTPVTPTPTPPITVVVPQPAPQSPVIPVAVPTPTSTQTVRVEPEPVVTPVAIVVPKPEAPILSATDRVGIRKNKVLATRRPHLIGTTIRGGLVELLDDYGNVLAMTIASTVDGSFVIQPIRNLKVGTLNLRFRVRDAAGRQSESGVPISLSLVNRQNPVAAASGRLSVQHDSKQQPPQRNVNHLLKGRSVLNPGKRRKTIR